MRHYHKQVASFTLLVACLFILPFIPPDAHYNYNEQALAQIEPETPFCFAITGDSHIGFSDGEILNWMIKDVDSKNYSFFVINGDLTDEGEELEYKEYIKLISSSHTPILSVIGNHDVHHDGREYYEQYFGKPYFSFEMGDYKIIILDSADKQLGKEQLRWLKGEITNKSIIITHIPAVNSKTGELYEDFYDAKEFLDLVNQYAPTLIFSHQHRYATRGNMIYTSTAGGELKGREVYSYLSVCVGDKVEHSVVIVPSDVQTSANS